MYNSIFRLAEELREDLISFTCDLVRIKSMTCDEGACARLVMAKMQELGYDEVTLDRWGNVLGRFGDGPASIMFDSHTDTVGVIDEADWSAPPFEARISDGKIIGRGSSDMKAGLAASIYGAFIAKKAGILPRGKAVYVSASSMEEDYDGEALKYLLQDTGLRPDQVIVCEPTNDMQIARGHRGRALIEIHAAGIACHGSSPELGKNPVYMLEEIIRRVPLLNAELTSKGGEHGTVALTNIYCNTASNNSVPQDATLILDRRTALGETEAVISAEMDRLVQGTECTWCFSEIPGKSWMGQEFLFHSYMSAWELPPEHPLIQKGIRAYQQVIGNEPKLFKFGGNTNAISTAGLHGIPTMIIGPGVLSCAHARDEWVSIQSIIDAAKIYALLIAE